MPKYINADELLNRIPSTHWDAFENCNNCTLLSKRDVKSIIDDIPASDVQEVKHGEWISNDLGGYKWSFYCSLCGFVDGYPLNDRFNFCPQCGAKMEVPCYHDKS